ncbi:Ig-like domain-containing protein, partial [Rhodopirellula sallentina]
MKNLRHLLRRVNPTKSRQPSEVRSRGPLSKKRRLLSESLEQRQLLAADVGIDTADSGVEYTDVDDYSIAHNYWNKFDVNSDGFVTALDALRVINFMNESGEGEPTGTSVEYAGFVDVNADHMVTSLDALQVINQLNSEGEGADDFDVRFELTPRNLDDSLITQTGTYDIPGVGTGIEYTVDEGDIFKLEVAVQDDRGRGLSFGVFQAVTDIIIDQTDVLAPAVGEIQGFNFDRSIVGEGSTPNSSIEFYFADDTSTTVSGSISDFLGASDSDTAEYISDAIVELSSLRSDLDISADDIDSSFFTTSTTSPYFSRIEYNGLDLVLDDIPRLETRLIIDGTEVVVPTIEENVMVNGEFNPNTLVSRYETFMRNAGQNVPVDPNNNDGLGPLIYGQDRNIGSFDTDVNGTDIFDEVGTLGPVGNLTAIIEDFTFTTAYDAFSIPVIAISAASDVGVKLDQVEPREGFEGVLIYGTDNGKEGVDPDRVRLDERSEFQLNVIGTQTGITASNASLGVEEDDNDGESVQLTVNASSGETPTYVVTNQTTDLGTASISSTGEFTYVPDADAFGTDLVTFTASTTSDGTATATVTVTIAAVNDAPVANDDSGISVEVGNSVNISVLANDDAGGNFSEPLSELSISFGTTAPTLGTTQIVNDQIVYTPTLGVASGTDTFTYTVSDGEFTSNEATVTVSVINNQVGVSAGDKSITIDEDNGGATTSAALVADLDDADASLIAINTGTGFTLNSATLTMGSGTVTFDDNTNEIFYTPAQDFNGTAEITYNASNSEGGDDGVITVTVTPINDAPVATDLDFNINEGTTMTYNVLSPGSQTGPSDVETPTGNLTVNVVSQPTDFGTVSVVNNQIVVESTGTFADGGFSFTYNVTDADGAVSNSGVIDINVLNVQDGPVASNSTQPAVTEGVQTLSVDLDSLTTVENDVDLTYTIETLPSFGSASISNDTLLFTLGADENGTTTVVYRAEVTGNSSLFDTGTITFTVNAENDAPVLGAIANQTVPEFSFVDIDVLAQASDVDNATSSLTVEIVSQGTKGTATVSDGVVRYSHDTDQLGADTIQVLVRDPGGLASATQTININITDVVLAPVASDSTISAVEDGADVELDLNNLVNAQAGVVTFTFTQPSDGSASVTNGVLTYTPDADFFGQTSMTYTATNALGSDTGTITINVTGTNDDPIAVADSVEAIKNLTIEIDVLSNDTPNPGGESDTITVTVESGDEPANGT